MGRGEMPTEPGDRLFSPKSLVGERRARVAEVGRWMGEGALSLPNPTKPRMPPAGARQLDGGR